MFQNKEIKHLCVFKGQSFDLRILIFISQFNIYGFSYEDIKISEKDFFIIFSYFTFLLKFIYIYTFFIYS